MARHRPIGVVGVELKQHRVLLGEQLSSFPRPLKRLLRHWDRVVLAADSAPVSRVHLPLPRPNHKLNPGEIVALAEEYRAGASIKDLSRRYDLHEQTVRARLERAGVTLRPWKVVTPEQVTVIVVQYQSGLSLRDLGQLHGVSGITIRNYLLRAGVILRPAVRPKRQADSSE